MSPHQPNNHLKLGELFEEKYRVLRELGRGKLGTVYMVLQENMDRQVALKVLDPGVGDRVPAAKARFLREVKILSKLKHPNTVTIYDFGESPAGVAYMVLEYVEGETLTELLHREGAQAPERALKFMAQATRALTEAHRHGIIHRDLGPRNFMIMNTETERDFVKVLDFGMARLAGSNDAVLTDDGGHAPVGTLRYISPEQARGDAITFASDIYSLGLILYEVLAGEPAVTGEEALELIDQHLSLEPLPLPRLSDMFPDLQKLVRKATSKVVKERHESAEDLAFDLEQLAGILFDKESLHTEKTSTAMDDSVDAGATTRSEVPSEASSFPAPGDIFANAYKIEEVVGSGGFGNVYAAHRITDQTRVAIKVLTRDTAGEGEPAKKNARRFVREARVVSLLQCPHTISLLDFGESDDGYLFHVYEYCEGEVLSKLLDSEGALSIQNTVCLARQILASLAEAHNQGILHRDIKPSNLMIVDTDGTLTVRVIDFGIAKVMSGVLDETRTDLTTAGTAVGTPRYMSPEQLRGEDVGIPSDLYSLGLVIYEMLMGRPAIESANTYHIIVQQLTEEDLIIPEDLDLDPELRKVFNRLLYRTPANRFQSAEEVLEALPPAQNQLPATKA
ncbi:MAG: protein kinase domain-containing protein [Bradymonadaceae bacterium]